VPECDDAFLVVSKPVTLTILDTTGSPPPAGALVQVFDDETETMFNTTINQSGQATFTLPFGSYRFRTKLVSDGNISNGWQQVDFWSGEQNHCTLPECEAVQMTVPKPVTTTVLDGDGLPAAGMEVAAFDAVGLVARDLTDASGTVKLFLPEGAYRFSTTFMGVTHWSGAEGHCATPGCETAQINIPKPVAVTVLYENGDPYPDVDVRAFIGETPSAYTALSDENGQALIYAPAGAYRFGADIKGTLFYTGETNHCAIPGCLTAAIEIPGGFEYREVIIDYSYDGLYRLTKAEYSTGEVFEYTYDATGNRLTQTVTIDEVPVITTYTYDDANRLVQVGGQAYTWDNNGNLLDDGQRQYYYDPVNRLTALVEGGDTTYYLYNGQGDRIAQIEDGVQTPYILDLNAGLTQVLNDGTTAYVYGLKLVSQSDGIYDDFPLQDGLGPVPPGERTVLSLDMQG
jgi:YD repeat-containing protein